MAAATTPAVPPIPYGMADFRAMRLGGYQYVDKTRFLRDLEGERYAFLLRPRRFGKTCLLSLLEHYYDRTRQDEFETLFAHTDIGERPTAERGRHVVLRLNFSAFDDTLTTLPGRFEGYCQTRLRGGCFVFHTEAELAKGYADMVLTPLTAKHPALRHGYVLEIKYLRRDSRSEAGVQEAMDSAKQQLARYLADERLPREHPDAVFTGLALVFRGWELAACEAVDAVDDPRGA